MNASDAVMLDMELFQTSRVGQVIRAYCRYLVIRQVKNLQGLQAAQSFEEK